MPQKHKYIGKSKKYKKVFEYRSKRNVQLFAFQRNEKGCYYEDERECAIALDIFTIKNGGDPINILKKK